MLVIKKDKLGSIEKRNLSLFRDTATYKITYYDNDSNAKYLYFEVNNLLDNAEEIIEKLNAID